MKVICSLLFTFCLFPVVQAEVITDGSLGAKVELPGTDFHITPELGQQFGGNLFHSFQNFNLSESETATFSGANSVQNIIARVTGGQPSTIDGTLRSTIPHADLYFLNPYGILFGKHAKLDLQGGFHASTADYLKLQDGGRFETRQLNNSLLSVAPVAAFGFLSDLPTALNLQETQLNVLDGQTLSLVGGNLTLNATQLYAPAGQINLVSLAQAGQIALANPISFNGGIVSLQNQSKISTSGIGGGKIVIRGGQLLADDSSIESYTLADRDGKGIDIATHESVIVTGDLFAISTPTFGAGKSGHIQIATPLLEVTGSLIDTSSLGSGAGGDIDIQANQVVLQAGAALGNSTFVSGHGGLVHVTARDSVTVAGHREKDFSIYGLNLTKDSQILANSFGTGYSGNVHIITPDLLIDGATISTISTGTGAESDHPHHIIVEATSLTIKNGGFIASDTFGDQMGGDITIKLTGNLTLTGNRTGILTIPPPVNLVLENVQSGITSSAFGKGQAGHISVSANQLAIQGGSIATGTIGEGLGRAGEIHIEVNELQLDKGGSITSSSGLLIGQKMFLGTGNGGEVTIEVTGDLCIQGSNSLGIPSNISSNTLATGHGGNVIIHANHVQMSDGGMIMTNSFGTGNAGGLTIQANTLKILDQGQITTSAQYSEGGDIHITTAEQLHVQDGQIITSVAGGDGNSGNILLDQSQFIVLNQGQIKAQAAAGQGGNIRIAAQHFVPSVESVVSASSRLGIDGQISIQSPTEDVGDQVLSLSAKFLNASSLLPRSCAARIADQRPSEFVRPFTLTVKSQGVRAAPEDLRASHIQ